MDKAFEGFSSFITAIGPAGYPTSILGGVLMLFFYLRKQEAGMRTEIVASLQRLQKDKEALQARIDALQLRIDTLQKELDSRDDDIDALRMQRRELEDKAYNESRRADSALEQVRKLQRAKESD
jgi:septal ring factor EnvC (AmiA/AmiB activator)